MDDKEFNALTDQAFQEIEAALEAADIDFETVTGGVLEIEFDDGGKIIVNRHAIAKEIWVAARSGGFHFRWDGGQWCDTRDGIALMSRLAALVSLQAGGQVRLS